MECTVELNREQQEAVEHLEGPLLVLAGAGSGKTRCVTLRIANLLEHGVPSDAILAVTFTNKAAGEMRERVQKSVHKSVLICTYHSLGARILRKEIHHLGYHNDFTIYDDDDTDKVIKSCVVDLGLGEALEPKRIKGRISKVKNGLISPEEEAKEGGYGDPYERHFPALYSCYCRKMKEYNALDFDDLLFLTVRLFKEHPYILKHYQDQWQFVLIDEYQDTNEAQYQMINMLVHRHGNIFVVGDPDQSIYSWRGANIHNILKFEKDFPGAKVVRLEQNYRSTTNILNAANALITHNEERYEKKLWSSLGEGEKIRLFAADTDRDEARFVADKVRSHHREDNIPLNEMAVLYRTNFQSRLFEDQLLSRRIPYIIVGGVSFYQRREIKDVVSFLRMAISPADFVSFERTLNIPKRGIGATSIEKLRANANEEQMAIMDYCRALLAEEPLSTAMRLTKPQKEGLKSYVALIDELAEAAEISSIETLLKIVVERTHYLQLLEKDPESLSDRKANIEELIVKAGEWDLQGTEHSLRDFLEEMSLKSNLDEMTQDKDRLSLMTLHNGKGLEFDTVFIVGLENELLPHANARDSHEALEEERRLFYVGMTRAKKNLYLTHASSRHMWGQHRQQYRSKFLAEIPKQYLENLRLSYSQPVRSKQRDDFFSEFIDESDQTRDLGSEASFRPGDAVFHKDFGVGIVQKSYQGQLGLTYDVLFNKEPTTKSLVAKYAKLARI